MDIGREKRTITVEPLENPVPAKEPEKAPEREPERTPAKEPVPAKQEVRIG